jgi:hypothetical protein
MIHAKLEGIDNLQTWYKEITTQLEKAHGDQFCIYHGVIEKCLSECETYKELGVHQGGAAAAAILTNPKRVHLIDINLSLWRPHRFLFDWYCRDNDIELIVNECDSTDKKIISNTDVLFIDSKHEAYHIIKELNLHGPHINKYIIAHDTASHVRAGDDLHNTIAEWCSKNSEWNIIERNQINQGYTLIGKD